MTDAATWPEFDVLIVDDEAPIRDLLARVLTDEFRNVATSESGSSAIEHLAKHPVHVLITDLRMPGKNGFDVMRAARARSQAMHLVVMSGFVERADELLIESFGAHLLRKPFNPSGLLALLARVVGG